MEIKGGGAPTQNEDVKLTMLKKSQDQSKMQAAQLLEALPKSPNMPGVGGNIDITK